MHEDTSLVQWTALERARLHLVGTNWRQDCQQFLARTDAGRAWGDGASYGTDLTDAKQIRAPQI